MCEKNAAEKWALRTTTLLLLAADAAGEMGHEIFKRAASFRSLTFYTDFFFER